ncbi:MAG: DUF2812 domain-containing protein [Clostridiales Family XIII bacterium]|jgi:hypothetical protein|nr:DUF2812 domain-containing protein [Clostridiales Family XIII bacterium]
MKKIKAFVDMEKEEAYLNTMAQKGWALVKYSAFSVYTFRKIQPTSSNYRVDYRAFRYKEDLEEYKAMFEDSGWVHVCGSRRSGSQYFLPKTDATQDEDIFSDLASKAARYKRWYRSALGGVLISIPLFAVAIANGKLFGYSYFDPSTWFLTPGLWEKSGSDFWSAFFLELPFVILRILPLLMMFVGVLYAILSVKAYRIYKKSLNKN